MAKIYDSISQLVGSTPLLHLKGFEESQNLQARIYAKLEYFNPNQSVKDRIALEMLDRAEKEGKIKKGDLVVESTSGNTGIALAGLCAARGYRFKVFVQDDVSEERFKVMKALGAEVYKLSENKVVSKVLAETNGDFVAAVSALRDEYSGKPGVFFADQLANTANPIAHEKTTGPEIWQDTDGAVDIFVACVETGGTLTGTARYLKSKKPSLYVVGVQPGAASLPSPENPAPEQITGVHPFDGVPDNLVPPVFDRKIYDEKLEVETAEAYEAARSVAKSDGILVGTSSGAALAAAIKVAKRKEFEGKSIVVILPDTGLRYLSTKLFEN